MSFTFSGIKDQIQNTVVSAWSVNLLLSTFLVSVAIIANVYLWKSWTDKGDFHKIADDEKKKRYVRRSCDEDEEVSPRRPNSERSNLDKKLRKQLQRLQRKSAIPILAAVIRDPFDKNPTAATDDWKEIDEDDADKSSPTTSSSYDSGSSIWASGTGYGCMYDSVAWDMNAWDSKQTKLYEEFTNILDMITEILGQIPTEENMRRPVRRSCLILFVLEHLSASSMSEMNKHYSFFVSLLSMLNAIANHRPELHSLITMNIRLPNKTTVNVWRTMNKLYEQAKQAATLSSFHLDEDEWDDIAREIIPTFDNMKLKFEEAGRLENYLDVEEEEDDDVDDEEEKKNSVENGQDKTDDQNGNPNQATSGDTNGETNGLDDGESESKELERISYVDCMKDLQFDMVISFDHHKFTAECSGTPTRKLIRRLGSEFSDLAVSLPLTEESSIYLRVSESQMNMVKFLIIPADGTPYAGGAFVFDAYFPSNYPDGPPSVNLMTTGGGTVRFNPNLYENGYVCLSLLGTWSGQSEGEKWQPNISTFLQVVLSVQCLIFVPKPYYNEPGYEEYDDDYASEEYSQDKRENTVRWAMIDAIKNPTPAFRDVILKHFYLSRDRCMKNAKEWLDDGSHLLTELKSALDSLDASVLEN